MGKNHPNVDKYVESRVRALESLLLEKGILPADAVDRVIQRFEADTGPLICARAVARAWRDPDYKRRLLEEPRRALCRYDAVGSRPYSLAPIVAGRSRTDAC